MKMLVTGICALAILTPNVFANQVSESPQAASQRLVTIDDIDAVKDVGTPAISENGELIAYAFDGQIYVATANGKTHRAVTAAGSSASDPVWSNDGRWLYFLSDRSGSKQLWRLPVYSFGEARQVTKLERGLGSLTLSRDESSLLIAQTEDPVAEVTDRDRGRPWVISRTEIKEDAGDGYLAADDQPSHLYVYDLESETLRQVSSGKYTESQARWSPGAQRIVFVSNREEDPDATYREDVWVYRLNAGDGSDPLLRLTDGPETRSSPAFSPDGKSVAFLSATDGVYAISKLVVVPASGGEARSLTEDFDRSIRSFRYSPDGRYIYFLYDDVGAGHLARVRVDNGKIDVIVNGQVFVSDFDIDEDGNLALLMRSENEADDIYYWKRGRLSRITHANQAFFDALHLGERRSVEFASADGTAIQAFVTLPPGYNSAQKYPAILRIHGGPVGQFSLGYDFAAQYFAANGYVVIDPNPRGSTGRGQDFTRAIFQTWGISDYPDFIAAIDHVIELGVADPDRLAVTGYSYGGYMTNVIITETTRFKAAASGAGHSFIHANYGHDIYQKWYNWELGPPWENREKYDRLSPLLRVANVKTPTIFLGGRVDWNVPVINAELFYQSLKTLGIDTELVVYPDSHHGGWKQDFWKDYYARIVDWFDKYVATGTTTE